MPTKSLETLRKHGAKGAQLGCKCDTCRDARQIQVDRYQRNRRARRRHERLEQPGQRTRPCLFCGELFNVHGVGTHELYCRG